ncbi:MAG: ADP-glyceromanno-heptose 6-epimerase [Elusimicrobia bacterium]|nr:ADP-glyceromanno-heptose 6-epimerase [Elusimicrobiota bacterium]
MRILVTGGAGFIGSNLSLALEKKFPEAQIFAIDDLRSGSVENLKGFKGKFLKGKIEDKNFLKNLGTFDVIFHQAAITDTTILNKEEMFSVNVGGFENIVEILKEQGTIVYASSAGVYGNGPVPMKENQKLLPHNIYAESKVKLDEVAMKIAKEKNLTIAGLRYFNVYGPREKYKGKSASMILQLAKQMISKKRPRIFKWGEQKRDFIYVKDVVEANLKALGAGKTGIFNVGTGVATSFNKIIEILNHTLGTDFEPEYFDNPYGFYQDLTQADTTLAEKQIGFKAKWSIEEGISDYINNYVKTS